MVNDLDGVHGNGRDGTSGGLTRRKALKGLGAAGVAAALSGWSPGAAQAAAHDGWASFAEQVQTEFSRMGLVGAAVAVVSRDRVLQSQPLGVRDLRTRTPVTATTRFLVASTTKSMTSLLVATYVDQGRLGWDQRVVDAWPGFRAPTDELTHTLKVRDLLGMASGIGEPPALSGLHEGDPTAPQLLQSLVNLPVAGRPNTRYLYNNTVYSAGGYLPLLHSGLAAPRLTGAFANDMRQRVYQPVGMPSGRITDDPRGLVTNFARGHGLDLTGARRVVSASALNTRSSSTRIK
jgi:CubicO group peptidase (beta-lactamase class C family)